MAVESLADLVRKVIRLRAAGRAEVTLLAVCPNSDAVLEAAVEAAAAANAPLLFAATLNQVDRDGGYTGWTPAQFVDRMRTLAARSSWEGPLYPCLDHGGPWLKDRHAADGLSLDAAMREVKASLVACLQAGYSLLHIDATVDPTLGSRRAPSVQAVIARTLELIEFTEGERLRLRLSPVAYEVGTEEVAGGLVDEGSFRAFLDGLRAGLESRGLMSAWPAFVVAQVGTDLHTTEFDADTAARLSATLGPLGCGVKGHYTDWVANPQDYPVSGMVGANVGPEFAVAEYRALEDLCRKEGDLCRAQPERRPSGFLDALQQAVVDSGRWRKWLLPGEEHGTFADLTAERRAWLVQTGSRYVWTAPAVTEARQLLYENLSPVMPEPHRFVVNRIAAAIDRYITAFHLFDSLTLFRQP